MARVEISSMPWGVLQDRHGESQNGATATLKNLNGTNATTWSAVTGGSSSTASLTADSNGNLPRFVEGGQYTLDVPALGVSGRRVEAVSGSVDNGVLLSKAPTAALPARPKRNVITIFPTGHGFTTSAGTLSDDTADYVRGLQSVKLITDGAGGNTRVGKATIGPYDLSGSFFYLVMKVDEYVGTKLSSITVYASSDNFAANWSSNVISESIAQGRSPLLLPDDWMVWTVSRSGFAPGAGSINWASVNSIRVSYIDVGGGQIITAHINEISSVPAPAAGVISLTFDDGWLSTYTLARPKMDALGFVGTLYQIAEVASDPVTYGSSYMTTAQVQSLAYNAGWEIAAHAYSLTKHNSTNSFIDYTDDEVAADFAAMKDWLVTNGLAGRGVDQFAWPKGKFDAAKLAVARKYFTSARTTHVQSKETYPPGDPMRLRRYNAATNTSTLVQSKAAVDAAVANKDWLILNFHDIVNGAPSGANAGLQTSKTDFDSLMDYIAASGLRVKTVGDVLATGVT